MIRFILRFFGLLLLAGGFVALIYDGTKTIAGNALVMTPFGDLWRQVHPETLAWTQATLERQAPAWVWDPVTVTLLTAPAWAVLAVLGALLMLAGRRKQPPARFGVEP